MKVLMWSSTGYLSSGLNLGIHFSRFLGSLSCFPGIKTTSLSNQIIFGWYAIGLSSEVEEYEDESLSEDSLEDDDDGEGGGDGGTPNSRLGCGIS